MFAEMGASDDATLAAMERHSVPWLERMLAADRYFGWLAIEDGRIAASAGLLLLDWPPHPLDPAGDLRGYILNVFVEPAFRRRGLARTLTLRCMQHARALGIRVVTLHASAAGHPVYEGLGFTATNERMHVEPR